MVNFEREVSGIKRQTLVALKSKVVHKMAQNLPESDL